ncbi:MAG: DUF4965 domain-containing protein [Armatimonadetes bacterium]|nr:DUF4965 domain-containing protein [Armatimonadota bacterium]
MSNPAFRPPAVPLVTHDPYFSGWSLADRLTGGETRHWTGSNYGLCGLIRVDGQSFRLIGTRPRDTPAMEQTGLQVLPTRTIYEFEGAGVHVTLTWCSPLLADDLDVLSRPVTYITWDVRAADGRSHDVSLYFHALSEWVVNTPDQPVVSARYRLAGLDVLSLGSQQQAVLEKAGDNLRIDWGYLYLAVPRDAGAATALANAGAARRAFVETGAVPAADEIGTPRPAHNRWPVLACSLALGDVGADAVSRHVLLAYDDIFSIEYFHRRERPYWRRQDTDAGALLHTAARDYPALMQRCRAFDDELMADLAQVGGDKYAQICALAFRQCIAAHKLAVDYDGTPLFLSKENFSNGCIATVDVTYPSAPFFLLFNPTLLRAMLTPILDYALSPRWRFPFAPHDLGTYPHCNGQVYGGGERNEEDQMPVEECGNMLILLAALTQVEGHPEYVEKYWPLLTHWAEYLRDKGLNPPNQLCTDDFAGHMAHNVNLSVKAIVALGCFARLCEATGHAAESATYRQAAEEMVQQWTEMADDGDHYRLAFDKEGTWSQKYNLVWDKLLRLNLFPAEVAQKEIAFYKTRQNKYGLPLDSRSDYTKLDWIVWTATLADNRDDFHALVDPLYDWASETPTRVPLTDWYWTTDGKKAGFQARSVVGGLYIPLLADPALWKKWSERAR